MKVHINADIEGCAGITTFEESRAESDRYADFRSQMTRETASACRGALAAGAETVLVKDAHLHGCNIIQSGLPEAAELIRGWSGAPTLMVQELDESFAACAFVGWHAGAGDGGSPMAHTMSSRSIQAITVDDRPVTEMHLHAWLAGSMGVPVVFVTGDESVCAAARALLPGVVTVAVKRGVGASTVSMHPGSACRLIEQEAERAFSTLDERAADCIARPADGATMVVEFKDHTDAFRMGWYPGARAEGCTVSFSGRRWIDTMAFLGFCLR